MTLDLTPTQTVGPYFTLGLMPEGANILVQPSTEGEHIRIEGYAFDGDGDPLFNVLLDYLSADAHFGLGLAEYNRANYRAALFEFGEVTRLFPDRFDGHFNRAVTLAQLRRGEEAVAAFQEALVQATPEAGRAARARSRVAGC